MPLEAHEVAEALSARLSSLTPIVYDEAAGTGYAWSATADAWRESEYPLLPERDAPHAQHLRFFFDDRTALNSEAFEQRGQLYVEAPIVLRFLFEVPPRAQVTAWRAAEKAAKHALNHLVADRSWQDDSLSLHAGPVLSQRIPAPNTELWLFVEVALVAMYDTPLTTT